MIEERKKKEIDHYDYRARMAVDEKSKTDAPVLSSYLFCYEQLINHYQGEQLLDYGCGEGHHAINLAKRGIYVIGIDLSEKSLEVAREKAVREGVSKNIDLRLMDCEKMIFPNRFFDTVFDSGTFSSLDIEKALPEIARVLKPNGQLIGIETFGHNPLTNLIRKINRLRGTRTDWAVNHIVTEEQLKLLKKYFQKVTVYYFHLFSWMAFPLLNLPGGRILLRFLERGEGWLLKRSFFQRHAFKVVFIAERPIYD
ncbi:MAG: class I SAM-dependent methyltransferase [bacterium]